MRGPRCPSEWSQSMLPSLQFLHHKCVLWSWNMVATASTWNLAQVQGKIISEEQARNVYLGEGTHTPRNVQRPQTKQVELPPAVVFLNKKPRSQHCLHKHGDCSLFGLFYHALLLHQTGTSQSNLFSWDKTLLMRSLTWIKHKLFTSLFQKHTTSSVHWEGKKKCPCITFLVSHCFSRQVNYPVFPLVWLRLLN